MIDTLRKWFGRTTWFYMNRGLHAKSMEYKLRVVTQSISRGYSNILIFEIAWWLPW
jgi:hypothetical protein